MSKVDYQWNANHSIFGRYIATIHRQGIPVPDNHLAAQNQANVGVDNMAQSLAFGDTTVFGANMVNAFRVAYNRTRADRYNEPALGPYDLGIDALQLRAAPHDRHRDRRVQLRDQRRLRGDQHQYLSDQRRFHDGAREPPAGLRRERGVVGHLHPDLLALRRAVGLQRPGDGTRIGRLHARPAGDPRARRPGWRGSLPVLSRAVRSGLVARHQPASRSTPAFAGSRSSGSRWATKEPSARRFSTGTTSGAACGARSSSTRRPGSCTPAIPGFPPGRVGHVHAVVESLAARGARPGT